MPQAQQVPAVLVELVQQVLKVTQVQQEQLVQQDAKALQVL